MLVGIHIRHFGLLYDTTIGVQWSDIQSDSKSTASFLEPLSVLVGRNSTGKSSLIDALAFITDCIKYGVPFASTLSRRGGFTSLVTEGAEQIISFSLIFHLQETKTRFLKYDITFASDKHGRPSVEKECVLISEPGSSSSEHILLDLKSGEGVIFDSKAANHIPAAVADQKHPALTAYGVLRVYPELCWLYRQLSHWYICRYNRTDHEQPLQISQGGHKHINSACDNIENVLSYYQQELPDHYRAMISRISEKTAEERPADRAFLAGDMTSGNLKLFIYLLLLEDPHPRPLICLEEPDVGLYHDMVDVLGKEMRSYTLRHPECQIIFTTHSPFMLETMKPDEVWIFNRHHQIGSGALPGQFARARCAGQSTIVQSLYEQGVGLSAIWYSGHFDVDPEA